MTGRCRCISSQPPSAAASRPRSRLNPSSTPAFWLAAKGASWAPWVHIRRALVGGSMWFTGGRGEPGGVGLDRMSRFKLTLHWPSKATISVVMTASSKEAVCESKPIVFVAAPSLHRLFCARWLATDPLKDPWPIVELHSTSFCLQAVASMVWFATMVAGATC